MVRIYLSVLLLAMAAGQLVDLPGFVAIIEDYSVGSGVAWPLAIALTAGEVAAGGATLFTRRRRGEGAAIAVAVTVLWSALAVQALARGLSVDNCGCFGVYFGQRLSGWILVQDAWFVGTAVWAWLSLSGGLASWKSKASKQRSGDMTEQSERQGLPGARRMRRATGDELQVALEGTGTHILFLHDPWCPISDRANDQMENVDHEIVVVDVSSQRDLSQMIAQRTGVRHASPQVFVVRDGNVTWHGSHGKIKAATVAAAIAATG